MAFVPDDALRHAHLLSHTAFRLYICYCQHRNWETGRCDPGHETIDRETKIGYTSVSKAKRELLDKGWIERAGKRAVMLVMGAVEFEKRRSAYLKRGPVRRRKTDQESFQDDQIELSILHPQQDEALHLAPTARSHSDETLDLAPTARSSCTHSNLDDECHSIYEHSEMNITEAAEAAASGAPATAAPAPVQIDLSTSMSWEAEECSEAFVETVRGSGAYPAVNLLAVWHKLLLRCHLERVRPSKGRFLNWCSTERREQPALPALGTATVHDLRERAPPLAPHPPQAEVSAEELASLQAQYDDAQRDLQRAANEQPQRRETGRGG